MTVLNTDAVTAVILAGGRARRMGGVDKGLVELAGRPMVEWVYQRLASQVPQIIINANRSHERYGALGLPVVADELMDYPGPLAGMSSAMGVVTTDWILTVPCDSPFIPETLVERFCAAVSDIRPCVISAHDGERLQPVFNLMHVALKPSILTFLDSGERKIDRWFGDIDHQTVDFSDQPQAFINVNTEEQRREIELQLQRPG